MPNQQAEHPQCRPIVGFESHYLLYTDGTVHSNYGKGKDLTPSDNADGYLRVGLTRDKKQSQGVIHRLLAEHFIPNPDDKPCVDHIDRDRHNNDLTNLRWVTHLENCQNRGMQCNNTSGETGVRLTKRGTFQVRIMSNGKTRYKTFKTKPEAIAWYATMKATLHIA